MEVKRRRKQRQDNRAPAGSPPPRLVQPRYRHPEHKQHEDGKGCRAHRQPRRTHAQRVKRAAFERSEAGEERGSAAERCDGLGSIRVVGQLREGVHEWSLPRHNERLSISDDLLVDEVGVEDDREHR
jgi:hypothetical protein